MGSIYLHLATHKVHKPSVHKVEKGEVFHWSWLRSRWELVTAEHRMKQLSAGLKTGEYILLNQYQWKTLKELTYDY